MNTKKQMETMKTKDKIRFSRYCMKAAAGIFTFAMIGGCMPAVNPFGINDSGWTMEVQAADSDSFYNEDGSLKDGKYVLPVKMKNASNIEKDSMAASCIKGATLTVEEGVMTVTVDLQAVNVYGVTAWASEWKIYQENNMNGTPEAADFKTNNEGKVNQIQFVLPESAYTAEGVYVSMTVPDMNNAVMQAWLAMDFQNIEKMAISLEDGIYVVNGEMQKPDETQSMANRAIVPAIKLTVKDGNYVLTMNFKGLDVGTLRGYFSNLKYYTEGYTKNETGNPAGELADVTVESVQKYTDGKILSDSLGTNYPDIISFPLISEALQDGKVPLQVFVPVMEAMAPGTGTQNVYLVLDWDSAEKTTGDDSRFSEGDVVDTNPSTKPEEDTTTEESNTHVPSDNTQETGNQTVPKEAVLTIGKTYSVGVATYQATSAGTVTLTTFSGKKSVNVPATVTVNGVTAKVTAIGNNAFKKAKKKLKKVTIGANVTTIGKKAFAGCKKLKKITITTKKLTKVGAKAFKGINKKVVIKVPKKNKKAYTKLLKNKGQVKSVKIR